LRPSLASNAGTHQAERRFARGTSERPKLKQSCAGSTGAARYHEQEEELTAPSAGAQIVDWDDIRHFLALARTGSVRAAGSLLGVSHSTVARRVEALELWLSVKLFDRHRDGYLLTDAGTEMVAGAERVERELAALERALAGQDARLEGPVRVTCTDPFMARLLLRALAGRDLRDNARLRAARACITTAMTEQAALFRGEIGGGPKMRARVTNLRQANGRRIGKNRRA
jgi:molybdenum-dependent DNA-binding transcriptional regulator ModE